MESLVGVGHAWRARLGGPPPPPSPRPAQRLFGPKGPTRPRREVLDRSYNRRTAACEPRERAGISPVNVPLQPRAHRASSSDGQPDLSSTAAWPHTPCGVITTYSEGRYPTLYHGITSSQPGARLHYARAPLWHWMARLYIPLPGSQSRPSIHTARRPLHREPLQGLRAPPCSCPRCHKSPPTTAQAERSPALPCLPGAIARTGGGKTGWLSARLG